MQLFILIALSLQTTSALAQVDAIPDPHQDFYEQARPKRVQRSEQLPAAAPAQDPQVRAQSAGNDLDDAMSVPDSGPKPAPDRTVTESPEGTAASVTPAVTHPELMPRPPIPTPPAVSLLAPLNGGQLKDTLSWRTRAYKLRSESPEVHGGLVKASRLINAGFDDTVAAVAGACSARGFVIDAMYESAGQILVHPSDTSPDRSHVIISIKPLSKTSTLVRIGLDADNRTKQSYFDELLNLVESSITDKGLL